MMPEVLDLWLKEYPEGTVLFSRLLLIACMANQLTMGLFYANQAIGDIKWFSIVVSTLRMLSLPVSWLFLRMGYPAYVAIVVFVVCESLGAFSRVLIMSKLNQLNEWLKVDLGKMSGERHYSKIKPCVIAEAFLPVEKEIDVVDFKIHCFNGEPKFIGVCYDRDPVTHSSKGLIYSPTWDRMMILQGDDPDCSYPQPQRLPEMLEMAKKLSRDFPYVRVDLYAIKDQIFFGELTFSPDGNVPEREYTVEASQMIGSWLDLSKLKS